MLIIKQNCNAGELMHKICVRSMTPVRASFDTRWPGLWCFPQRLIMWLYKIEHSFQNCWHQVAKIGAKNNVSWTCCDETKASRPERYSRIKLKWHWWSQVYAGKIAAKHSSFSMQEATGGCRRTGCASIFPVRMFFQYPYLKKTSLGFILNDQVPRPISE